jgi:putative membrane protein
MKKIWIIVFLSVFIWSGIHPADRLTWILEVAPAVIGVFVLALTYRSFRLTPLLYFLILIHCIILMIGGHYTYAKVPFFEGLFGAARNNYDKLGHFAQGFVPAMILREVISRKRIIRRGGWRSFFIVATCLGFSAFYEFIEWWAALLGGGSAEAFLGTQGYVWDTQSDMWFAFLGAIAALVLLGRWHDAQLHRVD